MWERIKDAIADHFLSVFFIAVYLSAWVYNSLVEQRFTMRDLDTLAWLVGAIHGMNSGFNSPWGVMPGRPFNGIPVNPFSRGGTQNASNNIARHPDDG